MEIVAILQSYPLFSNLSTNVLWRLANITQEKTFASGEFLMKEGEKGEGCYIIKSGKVEVSRFTKENKKIVLNTLGSGEIVGELSIIDEQPRSASVMALEPTNTFLIERWDFKAQMQAYPEIALQLLPVIVKRLRQLEDLQAGI